MNIVLDLEGNGLRDTITKIHCIVVKELQKDNYYNFYDFILEDDYSQPLYRFKQFIETNNIESIIGHNIISYDLPILNKLLGIELNEQTKIIDTFIISQLLNPDRQLPKGCPVSIQDPATKRKKLIGPHSLEALGWKLGEKKIHHYDWSGFSIEMLERCIGDVNITEKVYLDFMEQLKC